MVENIELYFLSGVITSAIILFVVTHLRPLTGKGISELSHKRRQNAIRKYFVFDKRPYFVGSTVKSRMNPNGRFYEIEKTLYEFPSYTAGMLKYKKHEWIIVAFEKQRNVLKLWLNKGFDRTRVGLFLNKEEIANMAKESNCDSVLIFHNHPNINPNYYSYHRPSENDLISAKEFAQLFNNEGLNLVEFICERGMHYQYFLSPSDRFMPVEIFSKEISLINGRSRFRNFCLHWERLF